jgi:putative ABC transport system ATP-binding protein
MRVENHAVRCLGITKEFGKGDSRMLVLRGVNLEVRFGEITMLVGQSGCGKTTLLSIIAGLLEPSGGKLEVLGLRPESRNENDRIVFRRKNLGFVFQQFNLLPALTAAENAAVPLLAAGVPPKQAIECAIELLEALGIGQRIYSFPNQLSVGQQQRIAFARALIHEPRLIVCDEPTSALDAETGQAVMQLLAELAVRPDRAVIIVTHDDRIFGFGDIIHSMSDGRITGSNRAKDDTHDPSRVSLRPASAAVHH